MLRPGSRHQDAIGTDPTAAPPEPLRVFLSFGYTLQRPHPSAFGGGHKPGLGSAKAKADLETMEPYGRRYPLVKRNPNTLTWTEVVRMER